MEIVFYEKPGCINNARQKVLLVQAGHKVEARSLLDYPFSAATLRPFFAARSLAEWFNPSAPRLKSGEVQPELLDEAAALQAMLADRLLIRRPLIEAQGRQVAGFDPAIQRWLVATTADNLEQCPKSDKPGCD
jgi:nitrogenase-associated protein